MTEKDCDSERYISEAGSPVEVCCDLCGSAEHRRIYQLQNTWIVKCQCCGHKFVNPRLPTDVLLKKLDYWAERDVMEPGRLSEGYNQASVNLFKRYLSWISRGLGCGMAGIQLLDIGCGTGGFMNVAKTMGANVTGIEIGKPSARYAAEVRKLPVIHGTLWDMSFEAESFDVIVMMDVIEHLESPSMAVKRCLEWLRHGGILFITTPNFNSLFRRLYGTRWWVINCEDEHIHFFTLSSLNQLLRSHSFEPIFQHIRTIDVAGLVSQMFSSSHDNAEKKDRKGYYHGIAARQRMKKILAKAGILNMCRWLNTGLDPLFSYRYSPFYEIGEQAVVIGRRLS